MDPAAKQSFIRDRATVRSIKWSSHALGELTPEGLFVPDVEAALQRAELIEDYVNVHRFLPDCLVLAFIHSGEPIHAVIALDQPQGYILIVTVYRPMAEEWHDGWRTRK